MVAGDSMCCHAGSPFRKDKKILKKGGDVRPKFNGMCCYSFWLKQKSWGKDGLTLMT
jgi:hypothetical protein